MKTPVTRCMASLCMAVGALAAAPAQAAYTTTIDCSKTVLTDDPLVNPGYTSCSGPVGPDPDPMSPQQGRLTGSQSELDDLRDTFGAVNPNVGTTIPFTYFGKSNDANSGPFTSNPGAPAGVLTFDPTLSIAGTFFVLGFESDSLNNYSYYLFDSRSFRTLSVEFDTRGITKGDGSQDQVAGVPIGPNLAYAGLYVQVLSPTGGAVPEPAGIALIATAFGALALTTRRRRG